MNESLKEAARSGDVKALESLMNQSFKSQGITVRVTNAGSLLKVALRSKSHPDRNLSKSIKKGLNSLKPQGFSKVFVKAEGINKEGGWTEQWSLDTTDSAPPKATSNSKVITTISIKPKWYQRSWLIIVLLIFFPIAGIPLVLTSRWPKTGKITASIIGGIWLLFILIPDLDTENINNSPSNQTSQETKEVTGAQGNEPEYGLGDFVEVDGRAVIANKIEMVKGLEVDNQFAEPISGDIVLVYMLIKNTSNETGNLYFSGFELVDGQGRTYEEITDLTYSMWREDNGFESRGEDYYPGETRDDIAAFRVAPGSSTFSLAWKGNKINLW